MGSAPRITYRLRGDAAPEGESTTLANVYEFVLDCRAKKEVAGPRQADVPNDAESQPEPRTDPLTDVRDLLHEYREVDM